MYLDGPMTNRNRGAEKTTGGTVPYYLMIAYLACEYLQPGVKYPILAPFRPVLIVGVLAGISSIAYLYSRRGRPLVFGTQTKIMLVTLAFMGASLIGAYVQQRAFDFWMMLAKRLVFLFLMINVIDTLAKLRGLLHALLLIHVIVAVNGLQAFQTTERAPREALAGVLASFLGDPNDFALAMNVIVPYAMFLIFSTRIAWARFLKAGCVVLYALSIVFTFSRGGFVTLLFIVFYVLMKSQKKLLAATLAGVLLLVLIAVIPQSYWERMQTIGAYQDDGSATRRLWAWEAGWKMALDNPILGMGPGNFETGYGLFYRPHEAQYARWAPESWVSPHSIYFQVMGELGFVGLGLFGLLAGSTFRAQQALLRRYRAHEGKARSEDREFAKAACCAMQTSLLAFLIGGAFLSAAYYPYLWLNAALTQMLANNSPEA